MKAIGRVIDLNGKTAKVLSISHGTCSSCDKCEIKGACHAELIFGNQEQDVTIDALNAIGAKIGDTVEVESSTKRTLFVSAVVFILPVFISILAYLIAERLCDYSPYLVLLFTFIGSFVMLIFIMNRFVKFNLTAKIVRILEEC